MMTGSRSMRELARRIGVSHQQVGRWLSIGGWTPSGEPSRVREPDPATIHGLYYRELVDAEFKRFKVRAKRRAERDDLPFFSSIPVQFERLRAPVWDRVVEDGFIVKVPRYAVDPKTNKLYQVTEPGARVVVRNTHWMRDDLRNAVIINAHRSRRYSAASVQSLINLAAYRKNALAVYQQPLLGKRTGEAVTANNARTKELLALEAKAGIVTRPINTKMMPLGSPTAPDDLVLEQINYQLRKKHEPATTGIPGTEFARELLFQVSESTDKIARERAMRIEWEKKRAAAEWRARHRAARKARAEVVKATTRGTSRRDS